MYREGIIKIWKEKIIQEYYSVLTSNDFFSWYILDFTLKTFWKRRLSFSLLPPRYIKASFLSILMDQRELLGMVW